MKKNKNDLISVIITIYNSKFDYFDECVASIVSQSYKSIEIIIVDDFSNYKIFKKQKEYILKKYKNKKIKFIRNKKNSGVGFSLNQGIKSSKGKYINWCSYDDYFHIDKLRLQYQKIKYLKNTIVTCDTLINYENLKFFRRQNYNFLQNNKDALIFKDKFSGGSFLIPKSLFNECGLFDPTLRFVQDYDMWLRWYNYNVRFVNVNKPLFYTRIHSNQDTNKKFNLAVKEKKKFYMRFFKKYLSYFLNFYSNKEILLIANYYVYRDYKKVANFIKLAFINKFLKKKKYISGYFMFFMFNLTFILANNLRIFIGIFKYLGINILKFIFKYRNFNNT